MQAKAREILEEKIEIRLQKSDKRLSCETVKEALHEQLLIRKVELKQSTYDRQLDMLNPYLRQYGDVKLSKITSISLQKYLMNKNWSKQYRVLEKVVLFRFYKYCYEVGLINSVNKRNTLLLSYFFK